MATTETLRRTAHEIFEKVEDSAHQELRRSPNALAFSGFAGGLSMGLTGIGVAAAMAALGNTPGREFIAYMMYPIGFIAVIIGRAQLFTENTLYPVALLLSEHRHFGDTARLWTVVLIGNLLERQHSPHSLSPPTPCGRRCARSWCSLEPLRFRALARTSSGAASSAAGSSRL